MNDTFSHVVNRKSWSTWTILWFNDAVSSIDCAELNDRMIYEWERICKEAVVAFFKVLFQNLTGVTEENFEKPQSG
jgi:hypothetical protein